MNRVPIQIGLVAALLLAPIVGYARAVHFIGAHPISVKSGGGYCYINAPHMHPYTPDRAALFQQVQGEYVFTGDPTPFGYDGDHYAYYGHHPIGTIGAEPVFCFIDGPHHHAFEVPDVPEYKVKKGVAFYMGPTPDAVAKVRRQRARAVNTEYRPFVAFRPTVTVEPPAGWQGEVWVAPPAVTVQAPGVQVSAPSVQVSAPGVIVAAPPPPRVVVTAPQVVLMPPAPQVVVTSPPGVYVVPHGHTKVKHMKVKHMKHHGWH